MRRLSDLRAVIDREIREHEHLGAIRGYNHAMIGELKKVFPLQGTTLLDLGASIHGYALEAALDAGVQRYEGIDLAISRHWSAPSVEFTAPTGARGRLQQMNAESLAFEAGSVDCLLSISTFEHFLRPDLVLGEMFRVLRPGGVALLSFEPIWTAPTGHHLHHFGAISKFVPLWSHLFLSEGHMREILMRAEWPADAPISRDEALRWIYHENGINRLSVRQLRAVFESSSFEVVWIYPQPDESSAHRAIAEYVSGLTPFSVDELLTRGLSVLLQKQLAPSVR